MGWFTVDEGRCARDGWCVSVCPLRILEKGEDGLPAATEGGEELCIRCGHCVAVCPHAAFFLEGMAPEQCPAFHGHTLPGPEQVEHLLQGRRSIRLYEERPVERELLVRLLDTVRYAPSGHNRQPVHWLVLYDREKVRHFTDLVVEWMRWMEKEHADLAAEVHMDRTIAAWESGRDPICREAPHLLFAYAPANERTAAAACTIALAYLELHAFALGLGTCWAGYVQMAAAVWPPMREALDLPEGHASFGAMMVGYPAVAYERIPLRNPASITWR